MGKNGEFNFFFTLFGQFKHKKKDKAFRQQNNGKYENQLISDVNISIKIECKYLLYIDIYKLGSDKQIPKNRKANSYTIVPRRKYSKNV